MAGYPSNLAKTFPPTEQFPQHILPLLPLYNAKWWGYESLTAIVLVSNYCNKYLKIYFEIFVTNDLLVYSGGQLL